MEHTPAPDTLPALSLPPPVESPDPKLLEEIASLTKQLAEQRIEKEQLQQSMSVEREKAKKEKKSKKEKKNKEEKKSSKSRDKADKQPQAPQEEAPKAVRRDPGPAEPVFLEDLAGDQSNVLPELDLNGPFSAYYFIGCTCVCLSLDRWYVSTCIVSGCNDLVCFF